MEHRIKKIFIIFFTFSISFAEDKIPDQIQTLFRSQTHKFPVQVLDKIYQSFRFRLSNRYAELTRNPVDLIGEWLEDHSNTGWSIIVESDHDCPNPNQMMAMEEAEGSVRVTGGDFETDLTYLFNGSFGMSGAYDEDYRMIMNLNFIDIMSQDFSGVENPMLVQFTSTTDNPNQIDYVSLGLFSSGGSEPADIFIADSVDAVNAVTIDTIAFSVTFNDLVLTQVSGSSTLLLSGSIGPEMIALQGGMETEIPNNLMGTPFDEFYLNLNEDSTGVVTAILFDGYGQTFEQTELMTWTATEDSLFIIYDGADPDYYNHPFDSVAYEITNDTLYLINSLMPSCTEGDYPYAPLPYEECIEMMLGSSGIPLNIIQDVVSLRIFLENIMVSAEVVAIKPDGGSLPEKFRLHEAYPNPFNPTTTIRFDVGSETLGAISLRVYDMNGRLVETLINEQLGSGTYEVRWNAAGLSSGVYFTELQSADFRQTKKMVLLK